MGMQSNLNLNFLIKRSVFSFADCNLNVLEARLELLRFLVSQLLAIHTEFEVKVFHRLISLISPAMLFYADFNVSGGTIVHDLEGDPSAIHAVQEGVAASVPTEGTGLVIKHS